MSPPTATMSRSSQISIDASSDVVSLRNFVVDEDRANLGSALFKTVDKGAFIFAQQEALEAFRLAKAIRLSEESAASEGRHRVEKATASTSSSAAAVPPQSQSQSTSTPASSSSGRSASNQKNSSTSSASDEAAARSLARSWKVEGLQSTLLENRGQMAPSSSRTKPSSTPQTQTQTQSIQSQVDKKPSVSKASTSQNVSLSASTFASSSSSASTVVAAADHSRTTNSTLHSTPLSVNVVPSSSQANSSTHSRSRSQSQSQSRAPPAQGAQSSHVQTRVEPRPILKRDPATVDGSALSMSASPPASASRPNPTRSSASSSAAAAAESTQQQQKRQRSERKASISVPAPSSQPQYSYSTSNYSYFYSYNGSNTNTNNTTSQASIQAQTLAIPSETKKSSSTSASSRDIQAGQILNPINASSSSSSSSSLYGPSTAPSSAPASKESSPKISTMGLPLSQGVSSASAQAAAAEREKERSRGSSKRRASVVQAQAQVQPQVQPQVSRNIFGPVRFNCSKCANVVVSAVQTQVQSISPFFTTEALLNSFFVFKKQPSLALTSPDPFSHPFASSLHVVCNNPACGAVHCRGCLQPIKCRDVDNHSDIQLSSSPPSSSASNRHPKARGKNTTSACAGGPGCAIWNCCKTVRAIAIWETLGAFDAVFAAEAGFQVSESAQHQGVGRQHREAYVKLLISKTDKSMRRFEDAFLRTLRVVGSWLQAPSSSSSGDDDGDDQESHETLLAHFLLSSFLLEVVHLFLSNNVVRDWIAHSETYLGILDLMKKMLDYGLGSVLREPLYATAPSTMTTPGAGVYNPFASTSAAPSVYSSTLPGAGAGVSLSDLVKQLETHRTSLRDVTSKIQFPITVDKVNKLCESISYLLLQQMVGGF